MTTKKQQKDEALKAYKSIVGLARKTYDAKVGQASKALNAKCKEINEQGEQIRVIDGKRYKLI